MRSLPFNNQEHQYSGNNSKLGLYGQELKPVKQPVCIPTQDITERINTVVDSVLRQFLGLRS